MIRIFIRKLKENEDAHAAGRELLREILGDLPLAFGPHGKPYDERGRVFFNLSHCAGAVGLAVAEQEVGLDLEPKERSVKRITFTSKEEKAIPPLTLWVLKESYVKWSGEGISVIRGTNIAPMGENRYKGRYNGKEAALITFETDTLIGALACKEIEKYEIKEM